MPVINKRLISHIIIATTDCSIIAGDLGPDQDICGEEIVILDGTPDIGDPTDYTYQWFLDTGAGFNILDGETNATLTIGMPVILPPVPAISGTYRILVHWNSYWMPMEKMTRMKSLSPFILSLQLEPQYLQRSNNVIQIPTKTVFLPLT